MNIRFILSFNTGTVIDITIHEYLIHFRF